MKIKLPPYDRADQENEHWGPWADLLLQVSTRTLIRELSQRRSGQKQVLLSSTLWWWNGQSIMQGVEPFALLLFGSPTRMHSLIKDRHGHFHNSLWHLCPQLLLLLKLLLLLCASLTHREIGYFIDYVTGMPLVTHPSCSRASRAAQRFPSSSVFQIH